MSRRLLRPVALVAIQARSCLRRNRFSGYNGDWKPPAGGKYTIQIRSLGFTGDYSFAASAAETQRQ